MKKVLLVGIGDFKVSNEPEVILKTVALGSCVAIILYSNHNFVVGMAHIALPSSSINAQKAQNQPAYFADTGITTLLKAYKKFDGQNKILAKLVGGASILDQSNYFNIGNRNISTIKKILKYLNIPVMAEETGGSISRTVSINIQSKKVVISHKNQLWEI